MCFVYILESDRTVRPYTGYTNNLERRLGEHNHPDNTGWTRPFQPWRIEAYVQCDTEETALIVEAYFANTSGREKFENFARDNPHHPNPKQGFFDTVREGRAFGSRERRFQVTRQDGRTIMIRNTN